MKESVTKEPLALAGPPRWMIRRDMQAVLAIELANFEFPWCSSGTTGTRGRRGEEAKAGRRLPIASSQELPRKLLLAAVERISYRLQETRRTANGHAGLIACKKSLVDQAMPKKTSTVGGTIRSCEGAYLGDAYGSRVHLGTDGIESKADELLAIGHRGNV